MASLSLPNTCSTNKRSSRTAVGGQELVSCCRKRCSSNNVYCGTACGQLPPCSTGYCTRGGMYAGRGGSNTADAEENSSATRVTEWPAIHCSSTSGAIGYWGCLSVSGTDCPTKTARAVAVRSLSGPTDVRCRFCRCCWFSRCARCTTEVFAEARARSAQASRTSSGAKLQAAWRGHRPQTCHVLATRTGKFLLSSRMESNNLAHEAGPRMLMLMLNTEPSVRSRLTQAAACNICTS